HLLARAIRAAPSLEGADIRGALENIGPMNGLVRHYDRPFTSLRHEALDRSDFQLVQYDEEGNLLPLACHVSPEKCAAP
ncbi:MAG: hypothetical protein AAFR17_15400, partial [Pseudomonadota bacterium]